MISPSTAASVAVDFALSAQEVLAEVADYRGAETALMAPSELRVRRVRTGRSALACLHKMATHLSAAAMERMVGMVAAVVVAAAVQPSTARLLNFVSMTTVAAAEVVAPAEPVARVAPMGTQVAGHLDCTCGTLARLLRTSK